MKPYLNKLLRVGLATGVVAAGIGVFTFLAATREEPPRSTREDRGLLVAVSEAERGDSQMTVAAHGIVVPAEEVTLKAEVAGVVTWQNPGLVAGGVVERGEPLVRLDARDYRLAAAQQRAQIQRARVELELEQARSRIAQREWELLGDSASAGEEARARALRKPQLEAAENSLSAAKSGHRLATLQVEKTRIRAPFNALVRSEAVGMGQLTAPAAPLATLVGTDSFLVHVSVPVADLDVVRVPGVNAPATDGSNATVWLRTGRDAIQRQGRVIRLLGDLDSTGQMARVVVEVEDPLGLRLPVDERRPLLLGAQVEVAIDAGRIEDAFEVPAAALREGDSLYVLSDGALEVRPVSIVWRTPESVFVRDGLGEGDQIVLSSITAPVPGMKLRAQAAEDAGELADAR